MVRGSHFKVVTRADLGIKLPQTLPEGDSRRRREWFKDFKCSRKGKKKSRDRDPMEGYLAGPGTWRTNIEVDGFNIGT